MAINSFAQRMKINNIHAMWKQERAIALGQIPCNLFSMVILNNVGMFF